MNPTLNRSSSQSLSMVALFAALMAVMAFFLPVISVAYFTTLQTLPFKSKIGL